MTACLGSTGPCRDRREGGDSNTKRDTRGNLNRARLPAAPPTKQQVVRGRARQGPASRTRRTHHPARRIPRAGATAADFEAHCCHTGHADAPTRSLVDARARRGIPTRPPAAHRPQARSVARRMPPRLGPRSHRDCKPFHRGHGPTGPRWSRRGQLLAEVGTSLDTVYERPLPRSLRHGTRAEPVRGFAVGAKPTTAGESVDSPRIGGEPPAAKTRAGRRSLP